MGNKLKTWLSTLNFSCSFYEKSFIFNTSIEATVSNAELILISEIKYYIFSSKRLNGNLSTTAFKNRLTYTLLSLKEIATRNGKLDNFKTQWNNLLSILP